MVSYNWMIVLCQLSNDVVSSSILLLTVGEVTYVELFTDEGGRSRVSLSK